MKDKEAIKKWRKQMWYCLVIGFPIALLGFWLITIGNMPLVIMGIALSGIGILIMVQGMALETRIERISGKYSNIFDKLLDKHSEGVTNGNITNKR